MTARRGPGFRVALLRLAAVEWAGQLFWFSSDSFRSSNSRANIANDDICRFQCLPGGRAGEAIGLGGAS